MTGTGASGFRCARRLNGRALRLRLRLVPVARGGLGGRSNVHDPEPEPEAEEEAEERRGVVDSLSDYLAGPRLNPTPNPNSQRRS